jgi:hypothetical protein
VITNYIVNSTQLNVSSEFTEFNYRINKLAISFNESFYISELICTNLTYKYQGLCSPCD